MVKRKKTKPLKTQAKTTSAMSGGLASLHTYSSEDFEASEALDDLVHNKERSSARMRNEASAPDSSAPLRDPADRRTARLAIRLHPHLLSELARLARHQGWTTSQLCEKLLVRGVNQVMNAEILDRVGRYRRKST
jgi:hypothetical protein